jgi:UDP-N-acetylglucosamine--N-acetylmuramyl-(pentapeptide) pyrophosphoryl-undecaprenol N-acetylglucosamine transferase
VQAAIAAEGLPVEALPFTDRIDSLFARCHAVLMRAGALSIAEAALFGKPSLLVPYPYAADAHQERNAAEFCEAGAGRWFREGDATPEKLLAVLSGWRDDPGAASAAAAGARAFSRPSAAEDIVSAAIASAGRAEGPRV